MFCSKCGEKVVNDERYCLICGSHEKQQTPLKCGSGWYYTTGDKYNRMRGPFAESSMRQMFIDGTLNRNTNIRSGTNSFWSIASEVPLFQDVVKPFKIPLKISSKQTKLYPYIVGGTLLVILIVTAISSFNRSSFSEPESSITTAPQNEIINQKPELAIKPHIATREGIIKATNIIRRDNGLPPLTENLLLSQIAKQRVEDMFKYQYFAHVSPTGEKHSAIAQRIGYHYKRLSENIAAISDSPSDAEFLNGWMQSPGHRSAILDDEVKEIGVAVRNGRFKYGMSTISVQIFGLESPPINSN